MNKKIFDNYTSFIQ